MTVFDDIIEQSENLERQSQRIADLVDKIQEKALSKDINKETQSNQQKIFSESDNDLTLLMEGKPENVVRGTKSRKMRREASKQRITIRIDEDLLEEFKTMVPEGRGYQSLINQALREWLVAGGVKGLLRNELVKSLQQVVGSVSAKAS